MGVLTCETQNLWSPKDSQVTRTQDMVAKAAGSQQIGNEIAAEVSSHDTENLWDCRLWICLIQIGHEKVDQKSEQHLNSNKDIENYPFNVDFPKCPSLNSKCPTQVARKATVIRPGVAQGYPK